MRYIRTPTEVEAMLLYDEQGRPTVYIVDGFTDRQIEMSIEEFERHFRKVDGRSPRVRIRKKTNYRSSGEAPRLTAPNPLPPVDESRLHENGPSPSLFGPVLAEPPAQEEEEQPPLFDSVEPARTAKEG